MGEIERNPDTPQQSSTPRTDAIITGGTIGQNALLAHAQQLERELAEAIRDRDALALLSNRDPITQRPSTAAQLTEDMVSAGEMRYLEMWNPEARDFASSPWGRNLVAQIYYAMQSAAPKWPRRNK